jgi:hypothetical protein
LLFRNVLLRDFYFFLQVHCAAGLPHPAQTPFLISPPQVLHGEHPHVWHIDTSYTTGKTKSATNFNIARKV